MAESSTERPVASTERSQEEHHILHSGHHVKLYYTIALLETVKMKAIQVTKFNEPYKVSEVDKPKPENHQVGAIPLSHTIN